MQTGNASRIATSLQGDLFRAALYLLPGLILLQSAAVSGPEGRNWALLIGVGNYQDTNVLPFPSAQRDVEELQTASRSARFELGKRTRRNAGRQHRRAASARDTGISTTSTG